MKKYIISYDKNTESGALLHSLLKVFAEQPGIEISKDSKEGKDSKEKEKKHKKQKEGKEKKKK